MKVLLLNQCFYPDVVSTAQHLTDLATDLAERGHTVTVVASSRGYDNPEVRFPKREVWRGIEIIRLPTLGLGKKARWRRVLDFASFIMACVVRLLLLPRYDLVLAMTSPPLISFLGALVARFKGGEFVFWVMDLNPDEAIVAGWLNEKSWTVKFLNWLLGYSLRHASRIVVLDRFMKGRINAKGIADDKLVIIPPWSHDEAIRYEETGRAEFRAQQGLSGKYVVMYSGNHSPCHPLDTLLGAAEALAQESRIVFCFVGGGSEFQKVKRYAIRHELSNIICLPYQPLDKLAASLSAADLHVVVMGDPYTGIVHPCKIYNILRIGSPFLYIGPGQSHVVDILSQIEREGVAQVARHGEVERVADLILKGARSARRSVSEAGNGLSARFSKKALLPLLIDMLETVPTEKTARIYKASRTNA
ncbi:MAG: colanic acid biosynthesis glycosyl transferase WcaI [Blastocatellia bacterium]|jgi:glycosyltransferase involved in cell wall biosynthesis|nr:colanic acid biosynthesis glycosyl transferase WcaI [Blastocatellia bacterium]